MHLPLRIAVHNTTLARADRLEGWVLHCFKK